MMSNESTKKYSLSPIRGVILKSVTRLAAMVRFVPRTGELFSNGQTAIYTQKSLSPVWGSYSVIIAQKIHKLEFVPRVGGVIPQQQELNSFLLGLSPCGGVIPKRRNRTTLQQVCPPCGGVIPFRNCIIIIHMQFVPRVGELFSNSTVFLNF